jgi:hypothetical protein
MNRVSALLVLSGALLAGCARHEATKDWLASAEAAHRTADRELPAGDVNGARDVLRRAAEAEPPSDANDLDTGAVRKDLYYRLALLEVEHGTPEGAVRAATDGLALGTGKDVFTANLEIVRGHAYEKLGNAALASRDYHDALLVTEALLDRSLGGPEKP